MPHMVFTAVQRLSPADPKKWESYLTWAGISDVEEMISFDEVLCPEVLGELQEDDWKHNVQEDGKVFFFDDLDYLIERVKNWDDINLLRLVENPEVGESVAPKDQFDFCGFDLMDPYHSISVFSNCGGWPGFIAKAGSNRFGLIEDLESAQRLKDLWNEEHPDPGHSPCTVWEIWRFRR
ncbi:MAG: hypothetical protein H6751_16460 [Candidatus Omnitrophica bacterium]|nr:hypothetical protein [Candidatus Omnitrophota bacterium]